MILLEATRGDDIRIKLDVVRDGTPVNVTGASFRFIAKRWLTDSTILIESTDFTLIDSANGEVVITINRDDVSSSDFEDTQKLNFNIEMTEDDGYKTTVARGILTLYADVG